MGRNVILIEFKQRHLGVHQDKLRSWALFDPKTIIILADCSCHLEQHLGTNFSVRCRLDLLFNIVHITLHHSLVHVLGSYTGAQLHVQA